MSLAINNNTEQLSRLLEQTTSIAQALQTAAAYFPGKVIFSTSFSWEDQLISHYIFSQDLDVTVFTLDTGRMFRETYSTWSSTLNRYNKPIKAYYPNAQAIEALVNAKGPNSFYESEENRKECCRIRKVEPLKRAVDGYSLWITGIRAEHSPNRHDMTPVEWDAANNIIKFHPLLNWSTDEVVNEIRKNNVPYNPLHDQGFVSIGCQPCTRAIKPGEDFRAGRWWWEDAAKKECGLHVH